MKFILLNKKKAFSLIEISVVILVIGILISGISLAFDMYTETSLKTAQSLTKSSRILRIDELSLWLESTSDNAFTKEKGDNKAISIWKDINPKSTFPIATNSTSASLYPSYISSAINNLPAASFSKTSPSIGDCLTISNNYLINNSENFVLYLIYNPKTLDDGIIIEKNNATSTNFPFSLELNSGYYKFSVKNSANNISVIGAKRAKINTPNLIRLSRVKGSQIEIMINDVSSQTIDTLTSSTLNDSELSIGCRNGATPANFINGDIGEVAFFNRSLNNSETKDIEDYLYKKWKIAKYTGQLSISDLTSCSVPASLNANSASVPFSLSQQTLSCKTGYAGSISYKCSENNLQVISGSCDIIVVCTYTETNSSGDLQCLNTLNETRTFTLGETGIIRCPVGETRTLSYQTPYPRDMKYKCNSDGTLQFEVRRRCYHSSSYPNMRFSERHPYETQTTGSPCRTITGHNGNASSGFECTYSAGHQCSVFQNYWSF